ncbi:MAG: hypothetical protein ACREAB_00380 [Blastocatellia bacterium]
MSLLSKQIEKLALALTVLLVMVCVSIASIGPSNKQGVDQKTPRTKMKQQLIWQTPFYQGLRVNKSTKSDVMKAYGTPSYAGPYANEDDKLVKDGKWPYILYEYQDAGKFDGKTSVLIDAKTEVIKSIFLCPRQLSLTQALDLYGEPAIKLGIDASLCPLDVKKLKEQEKLINENTPPSFLLYPKRGMYLYVREDKTISEIVFMAKCF